MEGRTLRAEINDQGMSFYSAVTTRIRSSISIELPN
jgi:hypothetical protein